MLDDFVKNHNGVSQYPYIPTEDNVAPMMNKMSHMFMPGQLMNPLEMDERSMLPLQSIILII